MRAVRRSKGIIDIDVGQRCQLSAELRIVELFATIETQILQKQHIAIFKTLRQCQSLRSYAIRRHDHITSQDTRKHPGYRSQRELLLETGALRTAQMTHQDHPGTMFQKIVNGW